MSVYDRFKNSAAGKTAPVSAQPEKPQEGILKRAARAVLPKGIENALLGSEQVASEPQTTQAPQGVYARFKAGSSTTPTQTGQNQNQPPTIAQQGGVYAKFKGQTAQPSPSLVPTAISPSPTITPSASPTPAQVLSQTAPTVPLEDAKTYIRQAPPKTFFDKLKDALSPSRFSLLPSPSKPFYSTDADIKAKAGAVVSLYDELNRKHYEQIATQLKMPIAKVKQNIDQISAQYKIPKEVVSLGEIDKNLDNITKELNIRGVPTTKEVVGTLFMLPVSVGILTNPVAAGVGLAGWQALTEAENFVASKLSGQQYKFMENKELSEYTPDGTPQLLNDLLDIGSFLVKAKALHVAFEKTPGIIDKFTKDIIMNYNLPQEIIIDGAKIKDIFQTGTKMSEQELQMIKDLGLDAQGYKDAIRNGVRISIPSEKIITIQDKPYFAKLKKALGIKPFSEISTQAPEKPMQIPRYQLENKARVTPEELQLVGVKPAEQDSTQIAKAIEATPKPIPEMQSGIPLSKDLEPLDARGAAKDMIRAYVERGDSLQSLKDGGLGRSSDEYDAGIGGYIQGKRIGNDRIIVSKLNGETINQVFKLSDIYNEIKAEKLPISTKSEVSIQVPEQYKKAEKQITDTYIAKKPEVENALADIFQEMALSEAGERIFAPTPEHEPGYDYNIVSKPSTFPDWVPSELRSKALFQKVLGNFEATIEDIKMPSGKTPKQRALYNEIINELDKRVGTDTAGLRSSLAEYYEQNPQKQPKAIKPAAKSVDRSVEGGEAAGGERIDINIDELDALFPNEEKPKAKPKPKKKFETPSGEAMAIYKADELPELPVKMGNLHNVKAIEFPELVDIARSLTGNVPEVRKSLGKAAGRFKNDGITGRIQLVAELFKQENFVELGKVLAHEIGHLIDWLPDKTLKRGNLLGRLRSLRQYMAQTFGSEKTLFEETEKGPMSQQVKANIRKEITRRLLSEYNVSFGEWITGKVPEAKRQMINADIKARVKEATDAYLKKNEFIFNKPIKEELLKVTQALHPYDPAAVPESYKRYRESSKELYAEALSMLLNSPGLLEEMAPTFYKEWFKALDEKPEVKEIFFEMQAMMNGERADLIEHRREGVRKMFEEGDMKAIDVEKSKLAQFAEMKNNVVARIKHEIIDINSDVIDKINKLKKQGISINDDDNPLYLLEERNYLGGKLKAFTEENIQPIYEELNQNDISWTDFSEGLFYSRIIAGDRSDIANPRGITPTHARELLENLYADLGPERAGVLQEQMDAFRTTIKQVAAEAHKEGLYTDEMYQKMQENPAYVTFQVLDYIDQNITATVKNQVGTLKDVNNVANSSILKMFATIKAIERNKIVRSVVKLYDNFPGEFKEAKMVFNGKTHMPVESYKPNENLVTYREKGKVKGIYVPDVVEHSINNTTIGNNLAILNGVRWLNNKLFRPLFITFNTGFQMFNFVRDFQRFYKNTPNLSLPKALQLYGKAIKPGIARGFEKQNQTILEMQKSKILSLSYSDMIRMEDIEDHQIDEIMRKVGLGSTKEKKSNPAVKAIQSILGFIENVGTSVETIPKVAGYYYLKDKMPAHQMGSFVRGKIGSPDFLKKGHVTPATNTVFMFSNAIKEGIRSDYEIASDPKTRMEYWWKTAAVNLVPKLLMFGALAGIFGKELQEMMQDASEYDRTNYTIIPLGKDDNNKTMYARIPSDQTSQFMGGLLWKIISSPYNEQSFFNDFTDFFNIFAGQIPSEAPILSMLSATTQYLSGQNPYDVFRARNILSDDEYKAGGLAAAKPFAGWLFNEAGGSVFYKFYDQGNVPVEETGAQRFLKLPIINNTIGRFIRITDYGQKERLKDILGQQQSQDARERIKENEKLRENVREFQNDPKAQFNVKEYEKKLVQDVLGKQPGSKKEAEEARRLVKKFKLMRQRGQDNVRLTTLLDARSNDEKMILLKEYRRQLSNSDYDQLMSIIKKEELISSDLYHKAQKLTP